MWKPCFNILALHAAVVLLAGCGKANSVAANSTADGGKKSSFASKGDLVSTDNAQMADEQAWDDESRESLRETLRRIIRGELRLKRRDHKDILGTCRESYIDEECPEDEQDAFVRFAAAELDREAARLASEQATWPKETDCDRLDRVEAALREQGIVLWQVSPCCDTCSVAELPDRVDVINGRDPGFRDRVRGYSFFIDQNMPDELAESPHLSLYLAYGWFSPDDAEVPPDVYEKNALGIAREVCERLRKEGFEVDWDGDFSRKIGVSVNWQRRAMLE